MACGATSRDRRSSARLARTSWLIPMSELATRTARNSASRGSPKISVTTPNAARIRLKGVSTLARKMLTVERLDRSGRVRPAAREPLLCVLLAESERQRVTNRCDSAGVLRRRRASDSQTHDRARGRTPDRVAKACWTWANRRRSWAFSKCSSASSMRPLPRYSRSAGRGSATGLNRGSSSSGRMAPRISRPSPACRASRSRRRTRFRSGDREAAVGGGIRKAGDEA